MESLAYILLLLQKVMETWLMRFTGTAPSVETYGRPAALRGASCVDCCISTTLTTGKTSDESNPKESSPS